MVPIYTKTSTGSGEAIGSSAMATFSMPIVPDLHRVFTLERVCWQLMPHLYHAEGPWSCPPLQILLDKVLSRPNTDNPSSSSLLRLSRYCFLPPTGKSCSFVQKAFTCICAKRDSVHHKKEARDLPSGIPVAMTKCSWAHGPSGHMDPLCTQHCRESEIDTLA